MHVYVLSKFPACAIKFQVMSMIIVCPQYPSVILTDNVTYLIGCTCRSYTIPDIKQSPSHFVMENGWKGNSLEKNY